MTNKVISFFIYIRRRGSRDKFGLASKLTLLPLLNYGIKYVYWIIFRNKVTDAVRKKKRIVLIVKRITIFFIPISSRCNIKMKRG